ncbi:MAG: carbonic anhydrase [Phycisphaerae bacterium]|nr:carbonic anhydrase [Phycisphaerae bacterium]
MTAQQTSIYRTSAIRFAFQSLALAVAAIPFSGCATSNVSETPSVARSDSMPPVSPKEAMDRLLVGNQRFVSNQDNGTQRDPSRRAELAKGQHPFAIVLACSDSRVPPELVFDQELGDIFVIRVAGNTADDVALGSIEYAVEHLGAKLVVVLGHERCGAVSAAVKGGELPGHLPKVVADILPLVAASKAHPGDPVHNCVWHNAATVAARIRESGPILNEFVERGDIVVVSAVYDLDTGIVRFLPKTQEGSRAGRVADAAGVRFIGP